MNGPDDLFDQFSGGDPIAGKRALLDLLTLGDAGEEFMFSRSIGYPRTVQVRRRWLSYVASRGNTVVDRLLDRLRDRKRYNDAVTSAYLFAGTAANGEVVSALYRLIESSFNMQAEAALRTTDRDIVTDRLVAYGYAGGSASTLWHLVKDDEWTWEKVRTFAFRGACASVARCDEDRMGAIERLITHEWKEYELVKIVDSPDFRISNKAVDSAEIWLQANDSFATWRRGQVADAVLREWSGHNHWRVRDLGAQILASLSFKRTATPVVEWLRREQVKSVRASLLDTLGRTETTLGADVLIEHFSSFDGEGAPYVAKSAWRATDKNHAIKTLKLIAAGDGSQCSEALVSLARLGHRPGQIEDMLDSHDYYCRLNAALAVGYLNDTNLFDRLVSMQREAANHFDRIFISAALAILGKPNGAMELNKELVAAANSSDYMKRVDLFMVHGYLQAAVLDGLAAGGSEFRDIVDAWRAELVPLDPEPKPILVETLRPPTSTTKQVSEGPNSPKRLHDRMEAVVSNPLRVFISYSHQDERMRAKLGQHLAPLVDEKLIRIWHDREIDAGANWENEINNEIETADIILLLVSASFLNSRYCRKELLRALEQRDAGKSLPIPIILRPCDWTNVFNRSDYKLQALPRDDRPVAGGRWPNQDAAFAAIAKELRGKIECMRI